MTRTPPFPVCGLRAHPPAGRARNRRVAAGTLLFAVLFGAASVQSADLPPLPETAPKAGPAATLPSAPPMPPSAVSPVAAFRQLLALPPTERESALALRPEAQRTLIRARLADYDALPAEQRETRLRATDLYWHLQQLMVRPAGERAELLQLAPSDLRTVLEERLSLWDQLPESDRQTLRQHENAIRYFARWHGVPQPPPLPGPGVAAAPTIPLRLQADLNQLRALPARDRDRAVENWRQFFDAPGPKIERALELMSDTERAEMQEVLGKFRALPAAQRQTCIDSFARLANLPAPERAEFLRRAERWEQLPPAERAAWRRLVGMLPPLPPVPDSRPALPPLPAPPTRTLLTDTQSVSP